MEQLNRTLRNPARIRFESARLDLIVSHQVV